MVKHTVVSTGTDYNLRIEGPSEITKGRISIGINRRLPFDPGTNLVAVILDRETLEKVLGDLTDRFNEMEQ